MDGSPRNMHKAKFALRWGSRARDRQSLSALLKSQAMNLLRFGKFHQQNNKKKAKLWENMFFRNASSSISLLGADFDGEVGENSVGLVV
jgi:hypothetical protein